MNTVQVSTVKVTSDVEVIFVNSKFTIKAMRAFQAAERLNENICEDCEAREDIQHVHGFLTELVNALEDAAEGRVPVQG